jgi:nuclear pore complex protein Nup155
MTLNDRVYYLAQSLTSAKSAANIGAEDVDFTSNLQERMDVASVQMEVAKGIEVHVELTAEEKGAAMGKLNEELMGLDEVSCAGQ